MKTVELCNTKLCAPNIPFEGLITTVKVGEQLDNKRKENLQYLFGNLLEK
jgi:hypothetical protein